MRKDIHCAHGVDRPYVNDSGGMTIVLTETNTTGQAECPGLVQTNASAVQWCTIPVAGATDRYQLYRENDPDNQCDGAASTFMVDYLIRTDLGRVPTCVTGQYPTVEVTLPVDVDPTNHGSSTYTLSDEIALRNGDICSVGSDAGQRRRGTPTRLGVKTGAVDLTLTTRRPTRPRTFER